MQKAKYVKEITVIDPDTKGKVDLAIYKHEGGGMFAIDSSFVDQVADLILGDDRAIIVDPFYDVNDIKGEAELLSLED